MPLFQSTVADTVVWITLDASYAVLNNLSAEALLHPGKSALTLIVGKATEKRGKTDKKKFALFHLYDVLCLFGHCTV